MSTNLDVKVVILGCEYSGKTSLAQRFLNDRFVGENKYQSTIGAAYGARKVFVNDRKSILLGLWDTAGSERYTSMSRMFYRCAKAAIICYDVTNDKTWDKVRFWAGEVLRFEEACNIYLVGTKLDLMNGDKKKRHVDFHNVLDLADELSQNDRRCVRVFETSAKTGENVEALFAAIAKDYLDDPMNQVWMAKETLSLDDGHKERKFGCCRIL